MRKLDQLKRLRATSLSPLLLLGAAGCGGIGEPPGWNAQEMRLSVHYDTVPQAGQDASLPLRVQFDTVRNSAGYPLLYVTVTATNLSDRELVGTTGSDCSWDFRAFDNPERAGVPTFEETSERFCRGTELDLNLPPGGTQAFPRDFLPFDSIIAGRGPGTYYFAARLRGRLGEDGPEQLLTDWLPAGSVELVR